MATWIIIGVVVAILTGLFTLVWWKVGDRWANDEYKKFGHGGREPPEPDPTVIKDFNAISGTQRSDPEQDLGPPMDPANKAVRTDETDQTGKDA